MNPTLKQLKAFIAVAESKSFADACNTVFLSQPALSMAIKNLEQAVGGKLLIRTTRSISLSPEGQEFLPSAKRLVADWDVAFNDLHNLFALKRGKISIAAMPSFASTKLPEVLSVFCQDYPNINVLVDDVIAEEVTDRVHTGRAEIGITFKPEDLTDFNFIPILNDVFVAALPRNHQLIARTTITWQTLTAYPLLMLQRPSSMRAQIEHTLNTHGLQANTVMEAHQLATLGKMVASGLGLSIVPTLCIEQMEALGATCRPLCAPQIHREIGVLFRKNNPLSAVANAMVSTLTGLSSRLHQ